MLALVARKRISCMTRLTSTEVSGWKGVQSASIEAGHLHVIATDSDAVLRRMLGADPDVHDIEIKRAGLAEAFAQLTQEAAQ